MQSRQLFSCQSHPVFFSCMFFDHWTQVKKDEEKLGRRSNSLGTIYSILQHGIRERAVPSHSSLDSLLELRAMMKQVGGGRSSCETLPNPSPNISQCRTCGRELYCATELWIQSAGDECCLINHKSIACFMCQKKHQPHWTGRAACICGVLVPSKAGECQMIDWEASLGHLQVWSIR